jgi:hypothetical protein
MGDPKTHKHVHKADKDTQKTHMGVRKTLRRYDVDDQVETVHRLLNFHLPEGLPLPVGGARGARDFGPLTEDRVKKFQRDKKIKFGTKDYMNGVVDDATWAALTQKKAAVVTITPVPNGIDSSGWLERKRLSLGLPPLNRSPLLDPGPYLTPPWSKPSQSPPPGLVLDSIQAQIGGQIQRGSQLTLPFSWGRWANTDSLQLQVVAVILDRGKKDEFHNEIQFGFQYLENRGRGADSRRDLSFLAVLNHANIEQGKLNLPWDLNRRLHLDGRWNFGMQEQIALTTSLSNGFGSIQAQALPSVNLNLHAWDDDKHVLQLTGQGGPILEIDPPRGPNSSWALKAGVSGFLGLTYTYTLGDPTRP